MLLNIQMDEECIGHHWHRLCELSSDRTCLIPDEERKISFYWLKRNCPATSESEIGHTYRLLLIVDIAISLDCFGREVIAISKEVYIASVLIKEWGEWRKDSHGLAHTNSRLASSSVGGVLARAMSRSRVIVRRCNRVLAAWAHAWKKRLLTMNTVNSTHCENVAGTLRDLRGCAMHIIGGDQRSCVEQGTSQLIASCWCNVLPHGDLFKNNGLQRQERFSHQSISGELIGRGSELCQCRCLEDNTITLANGQIVHEDHQAVSKVSERIQLTIVFSSSGCIEQWPRVVASLCKKTSTRRRRWSVLTSEESGYKGDTTKLDVETLSAKREKWLSSDRWFRTYWRWRLVNFVWRSSVYAK